MKYWEVLLEMQKRRGKSGLTLPFLIGSQKYLHHSILKQDIRGLILDILSNNSSFNVCIRYCLDLNTLIFEKNNIANKSYYPLNGLLKQRNLSVSIFLKEKLGDDIDNIIDYLIQEFQDKIDSELYSASYDQENKIAKWNKFKKNEDITFILESFMLIK